MLIRELAYDTDEDQLDLLIDALEPEASEMIPVGDDIFLRRSIETGKIVGAVVENYSLWRSGRYVAKDMAPDFRTAYQHIVRYLNVVKNKNVTAV